MAITIELEAMGTSLGDVVSFMEDIKSKETNVSQLREAIDINAQLERMGTSPTEIAGFIHQLEQENIGLPSFVLLLHDWDGAGLTPVDARSALDYREQLEGVGFDIEALARIAEAAGKLGSPAEVLEAVAKYGNLVELDEEVKTKREELETLAGEVGTRSRQLDTASKRLEGVRKETADLRKALATYGRLEAIGFDEKALGELAKAIEKYGTRRKVLTALNRFTDLSNIKAIAEDLKNKVK